MTQPLLKEVEPEAVTNTEAGLGATLQSLREAKQYSLQEVSARVKFSTRQIEALEAGQWQMLPVGLPLRGLVKNYGRFLDTDSDALLIMLDNETSSSASPSVVVSRAGKSFTPTDLPMQAEATHRSWGWLIVIVVLIIVAAFYAIERGWVPESWLIFDWLRSLQK